MFTHFSYENKSDECVKLHVCERKNLYVRIFFI